jgi:hypothetical protein
MKCRHWVLLNGSGMCNVAKSMAEAETRLGLDSLTVDVLKPETWEEAQDADIHVVHTDFPASMRKRVTKPLKIVWVAHGTPEHVFEGAVEDGKKGYGHADGFMLMQFWLNTADARVTLWPRHQWLYQSMVSKGAVIDCVPMGVDLEFWKGGSDLGRYAGKPSVWTAENPHRIKWPLHVFQMWPEIRKELPEAVLHANYLPNDMHRWFFPLVNSNGTSHGAHIGPFTFPHENLRSIFKSIDFFLGLVRYGDTNHLAMQANAAGAKTISYPGNPYSDYWVPEGDQRRTAEALIEILKGDAEPRAKNVVPDFMDTAQAMDTIFQRILCQT